ncbi:hypothetical protein AOQ84DRAFT_352793 [Glonium stellatum]|uniref:Uncharacterized protein n=1 Tax=Glonium stellatum TaxID=574774 RepID=A0A8E2F8K3_9PEZI|nr:hypothetical protein AOQ84DRAFT_352793 [Glonium stellatum]
MANPTTTSKPTPPHNSPPSSIQIPSQPLSYVPQHEPQLPASDSVVPTAEQFSTPPSTAYSRSFSGLSQSSTSSDSSFTRKQVQPDTTKLNCNSSVNAWYGRHSNSWLFNDFSVTSHIKGMCHMRRNSRGC